MQSKLTSRLARINSVIKNSPTMAYRLSRKGLGLSNSSSLYYVTPNANWVVDWIGHYLATHIKNQTGYTISLTSTPHTLVDHIIHYGDLWSFLSSAKFIHNRFNTIISTIFHGNLVETEVHLSSAIKRFIDLSCLPERIVTSSQIMETRLTSWGIPPEKIIRIPLGVDTNHFRPASTESRLVNRRQLNIPDDAICIGSFQKDGEGWGDGLTPKMIKGPDIFLQVVKKLSQQYKLHILLTASARGYVKKGLDTLNIPYTHHALSNYLDIVNYYHCLDMYLVTARDEGGPKAILEALACGVPLVSTKVGLAPDIITHNENGLLTEIEDVETLTTLAAQLSESPNERERLTENGLAMIHNYDWQKVAAQYYQNLYLPLLSTKQGQKR